MTRPDRPAQAICRSNAAADCRRPGTRHSGSKIPSIVRAQADGAFGKPLAAVSNSPCTVLNVSERQRHLGGFLRVDFLANGSSPLGA